jgi:hypothetical protein
VRGFIRAFVRSISFLLWLASAAIQPGWALSADAGGAVTTPPIIVIGLVGGFVKHDDSIHSTVQVAAHLRRDYPTGVFVEVFENSHREQAHARIIQLVDADHNGTLSAEEKKNARIVLYGHSWGASEVVSLARQLDKEGIPVQLTVQVDSVAKRGQNDRVIPANVAEAANFFQLDGFLHGQSEIRAADPARTHIIGNFQSAYKAHPIDCKPYPWYDRMFMKYHTEIECDPRVWNQVAALIRSHLPAAQ